MDITVQTAGAAPLTSTTPAFNLEESNMSNVMDLGARKGENPTGITQTPAEKSAFVQLRVELAVTTKANHIGQEMLALHQLWVAHDKGIKYVDESSGAAYTSPVKVPADVFKNVYRYYVKSFLGNGKRDAVVVVIDTKLSYNELKRIAYEHLQRLRAWMFPHPFQQPEAHTAGFLVGIKPSSVHRDLLAKELSDLVDTAMLNDDGFDDCIEVKDKDLPDIELVVRHTTLRKNKEGDLVDVLLIDSPDACLKLVQRVLTSKVVQDYPWKFVVPSYGKVRGRNDVYKLLQWHDYRCGIVSHIPIVGLHADSDKYCVRQGGPTICQAIIGLVRDRLQPIIAAEVEKGALPAEVERTMVYLYPQWTVVENGTWVLTCPARLIDETRHLLDQVLAVDVAAMTHFQLVDGYPAGPSRKPRDQLPPELATHDAILGSLSAPDVGTAGAPKPSKRRKQNIPALCLPPTTESALPPSANWASKSPVNLLPPATPSTEQGPMMGMLTGLTDNMEKMLISMSGVSKEVTTVASDMKEMKTHFTGRIDEIAQGQERLTIRVNEQGEKVDWLMHQVSSQTNTLPPGQPPNGTMPMNGNGHYSYHGSGPAMPGSGHYFNPALPGHANNRGPGGGYNA